MRGLREEEDGWMLYRNKFGAIINCTVILHDRKAGRYFKKQEMLLKGGIWR